MPYYHGSPQGGLTVLRPQLSEHGKPYVYFTINPIVAALYTVRPVDKPFHWYPYGFTEKGTPVYTEYYPHAAEDIYRGKVGYLYSCQKIDHLSSPIAIQDTYVTNTPQPVDRCVVLEDVYLQLLEYERMGELMIQRFEQLTSEQRRSIVQIVDSEIQKYHLKETPDCSYSIFLQSRFPTLWTDCKTQP